MNFCTKSNITFSFCSFGNPYLYYYKRIQVLLYFPRFEYGSRMFASLDIFPFLIQVFSLNIKNMMVVFPIQCGAKQQKQCVPNSVYFQFRKWKFTIESVLWIVLDW